MTDSSEIRIEATAHIIGAFGDYPREFGPAFFPIARAGDSLRLELPCASDSRYWLRLDLYGMTLVEDHWISCTSRLQDVYGQSIGTARPTLVYGEPYDTPTYTNFHVPQYGHVSLGLRVIG